MENLPVGWAEYAQVQKQLVKAKKSGDRQWGLEYALNKTLDDIQQGNTFDQSDVERRIQTGSRQNRHRSRLMRLHAPLQLSETINPSQSEEARSTLMYLHDALGENRSRLLRGVGEGCDYAALAAEHGVNVPTLRKRVSRLRSRAREFRDCNP